MDLSRLQTTPPWQWPDETDLFLLDILNNGQVDAPLRLTAVELAGEYSVVCDDIAKALLAITLKADENEDVRAAAAVSLGAALANAQLVGFEDDDDPLFTKEMFNEIQHTLKEIYHDIWISEKIRRSALEASVQVPHAWHQQAVLKAYESSNEDWQLSGVFCMGHIKGFDEQILEALESPHELIHYHAVTAAGNWAVDSAWDHVLKLVTLQTTEKELRLAAIGALAGIRPEESISVLSQFIESDDNDIQEAAYEAMAMAGGFAGLE